MDRRLKTSQRHVCFRGIDQGINAGRARIANERASFTVGSGFDPLAPHLTLWGTGREAGPPSVLSPEVLRSG